MNGLLADKVVVVSGVGPDLGAALVHEAAALGASVVLAGRTERRLQEVADQAGRTLVVRTDITVEEDRQGLLEATLAEFGRVDALIHNAFSIPPMEPLTTLDPDSLRIAQETNVIAPLRLTTIFADALAETSGSVVFVNSAVLHQSQLEFGGYKMSKGSLAHMASSLATELGPRGIRVNSIAPSYIWASTNEMYFQWLASESGRTPEEVYEEKAAPTDLKRLATSAEVARAAMFYVSDLSSAVTGTLLNVDCGEFHDN